MFKTVGRFCMVTLLSSLARVTAATRGPVTLWNASPKCTPLRLKRRMPLAKSMPTVSTSPLEKAAAWSERRSIRKREHMPQNGVQQIETNVQPTKGRSKATQAGDQMGFLQFNYF